MPMPMFLTVISGVLVFVFGQLILKGVLEPALHLKDRIAEIFKQLHLLVHQRSFIDNNYGITENDIEVIGELSAEIHSLPYRILLVYSKSNCCLSYFLRCLLGLPSLKKLQEASDTLNALSYALRDLNLTQENKEVSANIQNKYQEFQRSLQNTSVEEIIKKLIPEIKKLLNMRQPSQCPRRPEKPPKPTGNPASDHSDQRGPRR